MAAPAAYVAGFAHTMEQIRADQQVDPVALALAVMAVAKALARHGVQVGRSLLKKLVGGKDEDVEELIKQVDWKDIAKKDAEEKSENSSTIEDSPLAPRDLKLQDLKLYSRTKRANSKSTKEEKWISGVPSYTVRQRQTTKTRRRRRRRPINKTAREGG